MIARVHLQIRTVREFEREDERQLGRLCLGPSAPRGVAADNDTRRGARWDLGRVADAAGQGSAQRFRGYVLVP